MVFGCNYKKGVQHQPLWLFHPPKGWEVLEFVFFRLSWPIAMDDHDDPDDLAPRRRRLGRGKAEAEARGEGG